MHLLSYNSNDSMTKNVSTIYTRLFVVLLLLLPQKHLHIPHIVFGVSDVEMLLSGHVLLRLVEKLDVPDVGIVQRDSHLASELVDFVSHQDVGAHVVLTSLDGDDLASHVCTVKICNFDDVTRSQAC